MLTGSRSRDLTVPLPRNRKLLSCQLSHQQDRTRSMVEDESGNMSDRSRADNEFAAVLGAGANDHKFSLPVGCNVYNFALWPTLTLERFRIKKVAQPFIQDILRCCLLCLLHLILARPWRAGRPQKAFACVFDILSWTSVDHIEYAQGKRLSCQEHLRRLAHLFDVCTVQTTQYAHSLLLLCFSYRSNQIVNAPTNNISGVTTTPILKSSSPETSTLRGRNIISHSTVAREPTVVRFGPRSHPNIVAAMNPCWITGDACWIPPNAESITTAIGTLLIRFVPSAAPAVPTITAPKLVPPDRWISQFPNTAVSPVSSIARTTINIPAIKPKMDQEIRLAV